MYWEISSYEDSDDGIKQLLKLNPYKLKKLTKYAAICFILFFCNLYSNERFISLQHVIHPC